MTTRRIFWIFIVLSIIYVGLNFFLPPETSTINRYQLSVQELRLLRFSLVIPIVIISFLSFYGYAKFRQYTEAIKSSREGKPMLKIVDGLFLLALWLPVSSIVSDLSTYLYNQDPDLTAAMIIIRNYINLGFVFYAFYLLHQGSQQLAASIKKAADPPRLNNKASALLVVFGGLFALVTLINPLRQFPSTDTPLAAYYLPDWLLIATIIIPYILVFYWGLFAMQNIHTYRKNVRGVIYKQALGYLANGIGAVVISLITIRYITALATLFSAAALKAILLIVYLLIVLTAVGYVLIAWGAKKLQKIEEV